MQHKQTLSHQTEEIYQAEEIFLKDIQKLFEAETGILNVVGFGMVRKWVAGLTLRRGQLLPTQLTMAGILVVVLSRLIPTVKYGIGIATIFMEHIIDINVGGRVVTTVANLITDLICVDMITNLDAQIAIN